MLALIRFSLKLSFSDTVNTDRMAQSSAGAGPGSAADARALLDDDDVLIIDDEWAAPKRDSALSQAQVMRQALANVTPSQLEEAIQQARDSCDIPADFEVVPFNDGRPLDADVVDGRCAPVTRLS